MLPDSMTRTIRYDSLHIRDMASQLDACDPRLGHCAPANVRHCERTTRRRESVEVKLERVSVLDRLVQALERQITSGELAPGAQLPSEAALGAEWGVSRPVVREALSSLRERGYLHTVNGTGTFVRHPGVDHVSAALERHLALAEVANVTVDHLYDARNAIEVLAARLAATHATEEDIDGLHTHLGDMQTFRDDPIGYAAADVGFHILVARASKNPLLPILLTPLVRTIVEGVVTSQRDPIGVELGIQGHGIVLARLQDRDPAGAAAAMRQHLADSRTLFPNELFGDGVTGRTIRDK